MNRLKRGYEHIYEYCSGFFLNKKTKFLSTIVVTSAAGYLMIKKLFNCSISEWLKVNFVHHTGIEIYVWTAGIILTLAILSKIVALFFETFPVSVFLDIEPVEISQALHRMNSEITGHIKKWQKKSGLKLKELQEQHQFDYNIRNLSECMAEHIKNSIVPIKIKNKDVFISIYSYDKAKELLSYELHYDQKRDVIENREISINNEEYENYVCVKCLNSNQKTAYVLKKEDYQKGHSKRYKTFKQYMGCKLENSDDLFGFLNIEFHNNQVFKREEQMEDFMEKNIFPFKLLFEYQYLKKKFFKQLHELEKKMEEYDGNSCSKPSSF